jgi:hypothetical protein
MSPYSGLLEFFEAKGLLTNQGNRLKYITKSGDEILEFRKKWTDDKLDLVIADWNNEDLDAEVHGLESLEVDANGEIVDENSELNEV